MVFQVAVPDRFSVLPRSRRVGVPDGGNVTFDPAQATGQCVAGSVALVGHRVVRFNGQHFRQWIARETSPPILEVVWALGTEQQRPRCAHSVARSKGGMGEMEGRITACIPLSPGIVTSGQCHQDAHSCAERSVKRKKRDFHLLQIRTAGCDRWFFWLMLAAMCQHIVAWLIHAAHWLD